MPPQHLSTLLTRLAAEHLTHSSQLTHSPFRMPPPSGSELLSSRRKLSPDGQRDLAEALKWQFALENWAMAAPEGYKKPLITPVAGTEEMMMAEKMMRQAAGRAESVRDSDEKGSSAQSGGRAGNTQAGGESDAGESSMVANEAAGLDAAELGQVAEPPPDGFKNPGLDDETFV